MYKLAFTLFALLPWATSGSCITTPKTVAEKVLLQLYQKAGRADKPLPALSISEENKKVAAYYPARHQIVLDEKAYRLCTEMGKDSLNALAFILAHELAHAFQAEQGRQSTNFLVYGIEDSNSNSREKAADIQGAFTTYLAGYRIEGILPAILERIYKAYGLWGKAVPGYPSFEERSNSAREVQAMSRRLISVFEAANYLAVLEYYSLAIGCHTFLLNYYQGRDIYNNLGVLHVLQALAYYEESTDRFAHPLEMEAGSLLRELDRQRGEGAPTEAEKEQRAALLQTALSYFQQALDREGSYLPAVGNAACALNLLNRPEEAIAFLKKHQFRPGKNGNPANLQLAYGISIALQNGQEKAEAAFRQLLSESTPNALYTLTAQYNLEALNGRALSFNPPPPFQLPEAIVRKGRGLQLGLAGSQQTLVLDPRNGITLSISRKDNLSEISFGDGSGAIVSLLWWERAAGQKLLPLEISNLSVPLSRQFFYNVIPGPEGSYIRSDRDGLMLKTNRSGEVEEIIRWVRHRRKD